MDKLTLADVKSLFAELNRMASTHRDYLIKLDSEMGDGDLGLTMSAIFHAAEQTAAEYSDTDIGALFMKAGMVMAKTAPSTMGTLVATGFMRGGKATKGQEALALSDIARFWQAFVEGISERGKAKAGDKTILDALFPAVETLNDSLNQKGSLTEAIDAAKQSARQGMEATKTMIAQHGRAAYFQEQSRDKVDPGAVLGSLLIDTFADYINR